MSFFTAQDNARLHFAQLGEGEPIVFLHPTPLDHDYWRPLMEGLRGRCCVAPDFRGHGASDLGSALSSGAFALVPDAPAMKISQLATDTLALLDHLDIQSAVFAGCSIGGYVLFEIWRQAPLRVRGMAFIASKPQADTEAGLAKRKENIERFRRGERDAVLEGMAKALAGATAQQHNPELIPTLLKRMQAVSDDALVAVQAGLAARPDSLPTVSSITVPLLAIAGAEDKTVTTAEMRALQSAPGGCDFHELAENGHFAAYESPDRVRTLLDAWLRERSL